MLIFERKLDEINKKLDKLAKKLEAKNIAEYVELVNNTKSLIWKNFIMGISKGIGIAIGVTILGAIAIYLLRKIVMLNLPVIGAFIIGICENIIKGMELTVFSNAFTFVLLIIILMVKPTGLFGEKNIDKV